MFRASLIPRTKAWILATCTAIKTWKTINLGSGLNLQGNGLLQTVFIKNFKLRRYDEELPNNPSETEGLGAIVFALLNLIPSVLVRALLYNFLKPAYIPQKGEVAQRGSGSRWGNFAGQRTKQRQDR